MISKVTPIPFNNQFPNLKNGITKAAVAIFKVRVNGLGSFFAPSPNSYTFFSKPCDAFLTWKEPSPNADASKPTPAIIAAAVPAPIPVAVPAVPDPVVAALVAACCAPF